MPDRGVEDVRDRETPGLLPPQPEISPLRINKLRDGQPVSSDSNGPGSESAESSVHPPVTTHNNNQGSECGLFPFPPPPGDEPQADAGSDRTTDEKQAGDQKDNRPETHAPLAYHHHHQILGLMHRKIDDIKVNEDWGNYSIFHLDWSAGNPKDPNTTRPEELENISAEKRKDLSTEDLSLRNQIAEQVTSFVNEVQGHPKDDDWSKTMFFGDWISNLNNETAFFLEMQIKRISGADTDLMKRCGINPRYVWLPLADFEYDDPIPSSQPSSPIRGNEERPLSPEPRLRSPAGRIPHSATFSSLGEILRAAGNHGFDNLDDVLNDTVHDKVDPVLPLIQGNVPEPGPTKSSLDGRPSGPASTGTALENIDPSLLSSTDDQEPDGLPRALPNPPPVEESASWGSDIPNSDRIPDAKTDDENDDIFTSDHAIAKASEGFSKSSHRVRDLLGYQRMLRERREETIDKLTKQPDFAWRKDNSYIYCVRVLAIPEVYPISNHFTGPVANRKASLLASGGWIVPPMEERIKWHNEDKENRADNEDTDQPSASTDEPKKPFVCRALPVKFDWSGNSPPRYYGERCPIWRELAEPCLEDVYWMVWQLLSGTQYVGFRSGSGFGRPRTGTKGDQEILDHNPFESPSPEALHLSRSIAKRL
ncbi:hypothetical protein V8F20_001771 [Naviculisporaceae sp. PSN 640]